MSEADVSPGSSKRGAQCWLMKAGKHRLNRCVLNLLTNVQAEPETRLEKGKDVAFSAKMFEAAGTTQWDGKAV